MHLQLQIVEHAASELNVCNASVCPLATLLLIYQSPHNGLLEQSRLRENTRVCVQALALA